LDLTLRSTNLENPEKKENPESQENTDSPGNKENPGNTENPGSQERIEDPDKTTIMVTEVQEITTKEPNLNMLKRKEMSQENHKKKLS